MTTKTHIAWSVAAVTFVAAMGLGGAFYRTQQANQKLEVTIAHLREEQAKIGALGKQDHEKLASEILRLEQALEDAQRAQRELTGQLFAAEAEMGELIDMAEITSEPVVKEVEVTITKDSPLPAYLQLRKTALQGEPYHEAWKALQAQAGTIAPEIRSVLDTHEAGITPYDALKEQLAASYGQAQQPAAEGSLLARLGGIVSIRKLGETDIALKRAVQEGALQDAAALLREDERYSEWLTAYDAYHAVLSALDALEQQLAGAHG